MSKELGKESWRESRRLEIGGEPTSRGFVGLIGGRGLRLVVCWGWLIETKDSFVVVCPFIIIILFRYQNLIKHIIKEAEKINK